MTQPVQEPTNQRDFSQLGWGQRQLYRRPAPVSGGEAVSWGRGQAEITTSNVDYVQPNFLSGTNATFERTSDAIYDVNGDGRLVILSGNPGTYVLAVNIFGAIGDAGSDTYAQLLLNPVAPVPGGYWVIPGWFDTAADTSSFEITFPLMLDATSTFFQLVASPWTQVLYLHESDQDLVFRIRAAMIKDSNFENGNTMSIICSVVRIGDAAATVLT